MALDTAEKRKSAAWLVTGLGAPTVTPNASKDQEWRQQAGWGFSGIAAGAPVVGGIIAMQILMQPRFGAQLEMSPRFGAEIALAARFGVRINMDD